MVRLPACLIVPGAPRIHVLGAVALDVCILKQRIYQGCSRRLERHWLGKHAGEFFLSTGVLTLLILLETFNYHPEIK